VYTSIGVDGGSNYLMFITAAMVENYAQPLASSALTCDPSVGTITATTFIGNLNGNATTATNAATASLALSVSNTYNTITTSSTYGVTCSFTQSNQYLTITVPARYVFTSSNVPTAANTFSDVILFINNTSTFTSSLSFPSGWRNLNGGWATSISSSRVGVVWLRAYGSSMIVGTYSSEV